MGGGALPVPSPLRIYYTWDSLFVSAAVRYWTYNTDDGSRTSHRVEQENMVRSQIMK